jgi:MSHA pilin protein MshA
MNMKNLRKMRGFTMIELVIVIAILGILAAFALPRFANMTTEANAAARAGVVGALNSALGIAKAKSYASNNVTVTLDGGAAITLTAVGGDLLGTTTCADAVAGLLSNTSGLSIAGTDIDGGCTLTGSGYTVTVDATGAN